jgi:hypothetical protein
VGDSIPDDVALRLCEEIRQGNRGKWYTVNGLWCWGCAQFSGEPAKRCFANPKSPGNRGCAQVNARFGTGRPIG